MQNKIIFLCGLKSCGKTYYAQKLSQKAHILWLDSDLELLRLNSGYSTPRELYKAVGATVFREKEEQAIQSLIEQLDSTCQKTIVSLGGGVCDTNNGLKLVKEHGFLVYLQELEHVLFQRMREAGLPPYLGENAEENFHELYTKRDKVYFCFANYVIKLSKWSEEEVLNQLEELYLDH